MEQKHFVLQDLFLEPANRFVTAERLISMTKRFKWSLFTHSLSASRPWDMNLGDDEVCWIKTLI